jgi:hypothetical protein
MDPDSWVEEHMRVPEVRVSSRDSIRLLRGDVYGIVTITDLPSGLVIGRIDASPSPRYHIELSAREDTIRVFEESAHEPSRMIDARLLVALRGPALRAQVCQEKLRGVMSRVSEADVRKAPFLGPRLGEDVCRMYR